jgi:hypothetical protein
LPCVGLPGERRFQPSEDKGGGFARFPPHSFERGRLKDDTPERIDRAVWLTTRRDGVREELEEGVAMREAPRPPATAFPIRRGDDEPGRHWPAALLSAECLDGSLDLATAACLADGQLLRERMDEPMPVEHRELIREIAGSRAHQLCGERGLTALCPPGQENRLALPAYDSGVDEDARGRPLRYEGTRPPLEAIQDVRDSVPLGDLAAVFVEDVVPADAARLLAADDEGEQSLDDLGSGRPPPLREPFEQRLETLDLRRS